MMVNIAVVGATGRMGKAICALIANQMQNSQSPQNKINLSFVTSLDHQLENIGTLIADGNLNLTIQKTLSDSLVNGTPNFDVLIDFTTAKATLTHLDFCQKYQKAIVIGTTGFSDTQEQKINDASKKIPIVFTPNMSIGVNLIFKTVEFLASTLDESFDAEIIEAHHNKKIDSPSGTALKIGQIIAKARGSDLESKKTSRGFGIIGKRQPGEIGFSAIRGGDIVGDHTVLFATEGEVIELTHRSSSRYNYAKGAVLAASFIADKNLQNQSGLFDMFDVLKLKRFKSTK